MDKDNASKHRWKLFSDKLSKLRIDDRLTDFTICVGEELIRAHRIILAANSDYFEVMFDHDTAECRNKQVTLKEVDPEAVKSIVEFWYTNHMKMTDENICSLLLVASIFQAEIASRVCQRFAGAYLTPANWLSIASACEICNFNELGERTFMYCLDEFDTIVRTTGLSSLGHGLFKKIIADDRLVVKNEINVFEAIIDWVRFDEENRSGKLDELMCEVRFASIDPVLLDKSRVIELGGIYESYRVKAMEILLMKKDPELYRKYEGKFNTKPQRPFTSDRLYVLGGCGPKNEAMRNFDVYDPNTDTWSHLPDMEETVSSDDLDLIILLPESDFIYAPSLKTSCNYYYYNLDSNRWFTGDRKAFHEFSTIAMIVHGGHIFSFERSYRDGDEFLSLLKYDLKGALLKSKSSELLGKYYLLDVNEHFIYVTSSIKPGRCTGFVQRYDSLKDTWEAVAPMKYPREAFGSCSYGGKIYVAGGWTATDDEPYLTRTAEMYDPKLNTWTEIQPMIDYRHSFNLVGLSGQIYAVGGSWFPMAGYSNTPMDKVEAYDPDSNKWVAKRPMPIKRSNAVALVTRKGRWSDSPSNDSCV